MAKPNTKNTTLVLNDPTKGEGRLKNIAGSKSDTFNETLITQAINALWLKHADGEGRKKLMNAAADAMAGMGPKDELEGRLAAQMVAAHNGAMECYRRSMLSEQTFEG